MTISSNMYGVYGASSLSSIAYSARDTRFRGGVTGWAHKAGTSSSSTSGASSAATDYMASVKEFGASINDAINRLTGNKQTSVFDMLQATSADDKAVSVKVKDQKKASLFGADSDNQKSIGVKQLASAQKNTGTMLNSFDRSGVTAGRNSFAIEKDGKHFYFNIDVKSTDTNRTVQEKMAAAINDQNTGVKASVMYNEKDKTSSLVLTGQDTGEDEAFTIRDVGDGNAVARTGAATVSKAAEDAIYTEDGVIKSSSSNEVDIGSGITAELKKVTEEDVTVSVAASTDDVTNAIYDLVNGFNQLRETAADASSDSGAKALQDRLDSLTRAYGSTLKRAGISLNAEGYMKIDKDQLTKAIENGQAEKVFNKDSGFTKSLATVSSQAESDPGRFLSYQARTGTDTSQSQSFMDYYNDYMSSASFTPQQSMRLTQLENTGMLLNMLA